MESVQLASALSVHLIPGVGAAGMAWLRLSAGAVIFLVVGRPPFRALRLHDLPALLGLGVTTYGPSCSSRRSSSIPLGTAVAVEFLDPLTVTAVRFRSRRGLAWLTVVLGGVVLVTEPWRGSISLAGTRCRRPAMQ